METNDFNEYTAKAAEAQKHQEEIQKTRVGGLGGSDAEMLYRIGLHGLSALTATDTKRIAVMMGLTEPEEWGGNAYTNAGHAFEDLAEQNLPFGDEVRVERETYLEKPLAKNFKTFAHADFTTKKKRARTTFNVIECKYVQKDTDAVAKTYEAQLQWYYIMGASAVTLYHGTGEVEPFEAEEAFIRTIEENEEIIKAILNGVQILDKAIEDGWAPVTPERMDVSDTSATVQRAFETLARIKQEKDQLAKDEEAAKAVIVSFMTDFACSGLYDEAGNAVSMTKASVSRSFDSKRFLAAHPEFDKVEYYTETRRKASITFKAAK